MSDVLRDIIADKHLEVAAAKARTPVDSVIAAAKKAAPARSFYDALAMRGRGARIIAECKKKSPSRGVMSPNYDPVALATTYAQGGAAAISVLTDEKYFGGTLDDLRRVRAAVDIPVLRKDFVIDAYQIHEARAAGADTFLLISGVLTTAQLDEFVALGRSYGMEPLIESHTDAELTAALASQGRIFGINNRNLKNFSIDLAFSRELYARGAASGEGRLMVCESGIKTATDIENMQRVGYNAFLIGEALVTHPHPLQAIRDLIRE